jgi:hypothetical protein
MSSLQRSLAFSLSTLLAACAGLDETVDETGASRQADDPEQPALTDTIVTVHADGTIEQSTRATTAEARQAERAAAAAPADKAALAQAKPASSSPETSALPVNPGCAGADLWLYDSTQANRLCISGSHLGAGTGDSIDLRTVNFGFLCLAIDITGRCTERAKWAGRVQFIYPGANDGRLYQNPQVNPTAVFWSWGPFQAVNPALTIVVTLLGTRLG